MLLWKTIGDANDARFDCSVWDPEVPSPPPVIPTAAISSCPLEGGVAAGPSLPSRVGSAVGDISTGNVIAGIAAGLQRQAVPLEELISQRALQKYRLDGGQPRRIDNLMAATIAGWTNLIFFEKK